MTSTPQIENTNVSSFTRMPTPVELHAALPLSERAYATVMGGRETLRNILDRKDKRLFVVVGPCSIHDPEAGLDYARRLKALQDEVSDTMVLVMRVYFEKPRTTESQTHREMSSGLSTPVGFKNGTDGDVSIAINAVLSSANPHAFLGINGQGSVSVVRTSGNAYGHVVLRGGGGRPNYDSVSVAIAEQALTKAKLPANLVVDCSHANSYKKPELQPLVMSDVIQQIRHGNQSLVGVMIESNIVSGNQAIPADLSQLTYGCSVTDGCIGWEETEAMLRQAHKELLQRP